MVEEKTEKQEHEHHEAKESTVAIKKSTLWGVGAFVLLVLLVVSIFTGGFGITGKAGTNGGNTGGTGTNTGNTGGSNTGGGTGQAVNLDFITSNSNLYPSLGPSNAKATVIELSDFQCPYCAMAAGLSSQAQQYAAQVPYFGIATQLEQTAQKGQIRFIYVPLSFLGQESVYSAEAAFCAADQGKFWQMHDALFAKNDLSESDGKYTKANLTIIAQSISGLDMTKFNSCLNNDTDLNKVQQVMSDMQKSGIQIATPAFFVNGKSVSASSAAIQAAINAA